MPVLLDARAGASVLPRILCGGSVRSACFAPSAGSSLRSTRAFVRGGNALMQAVALTGPDTLDVPIALPCCIAAPNFLVPQSCIIRSNCIAAVGVAVTTRNVRTVPVPANRPIPGKAAAHSGVAFRPASHPAVMLHAAVPLVPSNHRAVPLVPASHPAVRLHAAVPPAVVGSDIGIELVSLPGTAGNVSAQ